MPTQAPTQGTTTWLKSASAIIIGFGFLLALGTLPATSGPLDFLIDLIFWPADGAQDSATPAARLFSAISGGMMVGWGTLLWLISARLFPTQPELARTLILSSIGSWFVIDSIGSIAAGAPLNAVFNVGFLLAFLVPLWRPVRTVPG